MRSILLGFFLSSHGGLPHAHRLNSKTINQLEEFPRQLNMSWKVSYETIWMKPFSATPLKGFVRSHLDETFFSDSSEGFCTKPSVRNLLDIILKGFSAKPSVRNLLDMILEGFGTKPCLRNLFDFFL